MDSTIDSWTKEVTESLKKTVGTDYELEAAAAVVGELGRALITLGAVEDPYLQTDIVGGLAGLTGQLGRDCLDVADFVEQGVAENIARGRHDAPVPDSPSDVIADQADKLANAIGRSARSSTDTERRVLISHVLATLDPIVERIARLSPDSLMRRNLAVMQDHADQLLDIVATASIDSDAVQRTLHRVVAREPDVTPHQPNLSGMVVELRRAALMDHHNLSAEAVRSVSIACEYIARKCETRLDQLGAGNHAHAADAWLAVRTSLRSIPDQVAGTPLRSSEATILAAQQVHRAAALAPPADLARAMQRLYALANDLQDVIHGWPSEPLNPIAAPLPGKNGTPLSLDAAIRQLTDCVDAASSNSLLVAEHIGQRELGVTVSTALHRLASTPAFQHYARESEHAVHNILIREPAQPARNDDPGQRRTRHSDAERAARLHTSRQQAQQSSPPPGTLPPASGGGPRP